jgi:hypothetical protein
MNNWAIGAWRMWREWSGNDAGANADDVDEWQ